MSWSAFGKMADAFSIGYKNLTAVDHVIDSGSEKPQGYESP